MWYPYLNTYLSYDETRVVSDSSKVGSYLAYTRLYTLQGPV